MLQFVAGAFVQTPGPQQPQRQQRQSRDVDHRRRIVFARLAQPFLRLLRTRTFQTRAVAADRQPVADAQVVEPLLADLLPQASRQGAKDRYRQPPQRLLKSFPGFARSLFVTMLGYEKSSCLEETLRFGEIGRASCRESV